MVKIREVKVSDWDDLRGLLQYLIHERPPVALELEPLIHKGEDWIKQFPRGKLGYFVVAVKKDMIVGFAYLAVPKFYNPIAYIGIAVAKSERRGNVGSMLFYEVASWAATQHLQYIIADIWEWNVGSKKFFKSLGFEEKERFEQKFEGKDKEKIRMVRKM